MKTRSFLTLFGLIFLLLEILCTSCTPRISKPSNLPTSNAEKIKAEFENLVEEALKLYHQGKLAEAAQKFETTANKVPKEPPTSLLASLYTVLAFLQEKAADPDKATLTYSVVRDLLQKLKSIPTESDTLALLTRFAYQLKGQDRIQFWEKLRPITTDSYGKLGEGAVIWQIGEAYNSLNNYQKAYEYGTEALRLAKDFGNPNLEVSASIVISSSLIELGRIQEAEVLLQEVLPKSREDPISKITILSHLGLVNAVLGRENQTVKYFQDAIALARSIGATEIEAWVEFGFGTSYSKLKKPQEALNKFMTALSIFENISAKVGIANAEGVIAEVYFQNSSFEEAKQHALRAVELYRQLGRRIEEAKNLRTIGQSLAELNKVDEALEALQRATDIQVEERNLDEASTTYWWTIGFLKKLGRFDDIKQSLLTALDANAKIFADKKAEAEIRFELGKVYRELGLFSEALNQLSKVLSLYAEELSDKVQAIFVLMQMTRIYHELKDYENWDKALNLAEHYGTGLNNPAIQIMILNENAAFFGEIGYTVEALENYLKALTISQSINKPVEIVQLSLIGYFYLWNIDEYAKALECFERGFKLATEIHDPIKTQVHLQGMSHTFFIMQQYEDALRVGHEALEIARRLKSKPDEENALALISLPLIGQGRYEAALQVERERLQIAQLSGSQELKKRAYQGLGYVYLKMGRYVEAVEAYKNAITWTEGLRSGIMGEKHKIGFFQKQLSPYEGIIEALYHLYLVKDSEKNRLAEEALHFAELSKVRSWTEKLSIARLRFIEEAVPQEVRRREENLFNQYLAAREAYISASSRYRIPGEELQKEEKAWEAAQKKWEVFIEELYKQYPEYVTLRYPLARRRYPEDSFRKMAIREGETLIVYKLTQDWVYAWVVSKMGERNEIPKFTRLSVKTIDILKLVEKFLTPFQKVKYEQFASPVAAELFNAILQPVIEGVNPLKHLIIVPDDELAVVPFEVLVTEVTGDRDLRSLRFLGDQFSISYYQSAAILNVNREMISSTLLPKGTMLAVGDPIYDKNDERLSLSQISLLTESEQRQEPHILTLRGKGAQDKGYTLERLRHSGTEVLKVNEAFGKKPRSCDVLIGLDASESQVKLKDLTQYQYLHFAVHGVLAYDIPYLKEPALVLAIDPDSKEDGFLTLSEINELKLNADLVTLSACETGLGLRVAGEGVIGLSRAFMNAGARAVLVSLWKVPDQSTAIFMEEFYRLLAQDVNKVEALKMAKEFLRKKGYENPYFWAPFILIGD